MHQDTLDHAAVILGTDGHEHLQSWNRIPESKVQFVTYVQPEAELGQNIYEQGTWV